MEVSVSPRGALAAYGREVVATIEVGGLDVDEQTVGHDRVDGGVQELDVMPVRWSG